MKHDNTCSLTQKETQADTPTVSGVGFCEALLPAVSFVHCAVAEPFGNAWQLFLWRSITLGLEG